MAPGDGEERQFRILDRFDGGVSWMAHPDETMQRTSHALAVGGDVWVIDPVDAPGLDDLLAEYGDVAGVVVLLDRHKRDAAALARRHDVPVHLPHPLHAVADDLDAPTATVRHDLADTHYAAYPLVERRVWSEAVLFSEETGVLVVPEAVGTVPFFRVGDERLGVHPGLRLKPPTSLPRFSPDRVLVGHGAGVHEDATAALEAAVMGARRRAPRLFWKNAKALAPW